MWDNYYINNGKEDDRGSKDHRKMFVLGDGRQSGDDVYYTKLKDYLIHYFRAYNIEFRINRYLDTTWQYFSNGKELTDRYLVDFYLDGKKLEVKDYNVYLSRDYPTEWFDIDDERDRLHFYRIEQPREMYKTWYVNNREGKYFTLECDYFGATKRITITKDKYGNIEIYLDEHAASNSLCKISERKTGKKYCIMVGKPKPTVTECIDQIVSLIDRKENEPDVANFFELMIRDPRLVEYLDEELKTMPQTIEEVYNNQKKELDEAFKVVRDEYIENLKKLRDEINQSQRRRELFASSDEPVKTKRKK